MSGSLVCSKCGGFSWIEVIDTHPTQVCVCGFRKYLEYTVDGMLCTREPSRSLKITLPSKGSQLSKILGCLVVLGDLTSSQISVRLKLSSNMVTTNLSVLRSRGLVTVTNNRKGYLGGSSWTVPARVKTEFLGKT